jgi:hypothetical protein
MTKVRIMETQGNHDMKEVKIRIQPATKQEQLQVDLRPLHHIILLKRILVRDVDPIQQIQKMDMYETTHKETVEEVVDNPESVVEPTHNQNISLKEIAITIMVAKLKIVTMVEITTKKSGNNELDFESGLGEKNRKNEEARKSEESYASDNQDRRRTNKRSYNANLSQESNEENISDEEKAFRAGDRVPEKLDPE